MYQTNKTNFAQTQEKDSWGLGFVVYAKKKYAHVFLLFADDYSTADIINHGN